MPVPLAVAVPWLAPDATATLVAAPPDRLSVIGFAVESYATVALTAPATGAAATNTGFDGEDDGPVPAEFVAATVKVYAVPFVSPVTVMGEPVPVAVIPPGELVTV